MATIKANPSQASRISATRYRLGFLCTHGMSLLSLSLCLECLRVGNRVIGDTLFEWQLYSETGAAVTTSGNLSVEPDSILPQADYPDLCFVLASYGAEAAANSETLKWIRRLQARNIRLG